MDNKARQAVSRLISLLLASSDRDAGKDGADWHVSLELARVAGSLTADPDLAILEGMFDAFDDQPSAALVDALWAAWDETRQPRLLQWLERRAQPASKPLRLAGLSLLKLGDTHAVSVGLQEPAGAVDWVDVLLDLSGDPDMQLADRARQVLAALPESAVSAREEVCRWVVEHNHPAAEQVAVQAGYAPRQPQAKALFYLLTAQWEAYEMLDFDRKLLTAVMEAADEPLRRKIAQAALRAGWGDFVEIAAGGRAVKRLADLGEFEWEVILTVLARESRWQDIWKLAQSAPPVWSAGLLRSLDEQNWQPEPGEGHESYQHLVSLAQAALHAGAPCGSLVRYQAVLAGHQRLVTALTGLSGQDWLASASADQTVRLWNLETGRQVHCLEGHSSFVLCLASSLGNSEGASVLATGSADQTIRLWRLPSGEALQTLGGHHAEIASLVFNPQGTLLVSMDERSLRIWQFPEAELIQSIQGIFTHLSSIGISPDGKFLAALDRDKTLRIFSLPQGELLQTLMEPVVGWAFSAQDQSGSRLYTSSSYGSLRSWNLSTNDPGVLLPGRVNTSHLLADPVGRWLAGSDRNKVRVWQLPDPDSVHLLEGHSLLISTLAASPDGGILASGSEDHTIRLWQLPEAVPLPGASLLEGVSGAVRQLLYLPGAGRLSPDHIVASEETLIHTWAVEHLDRFLHSLPASLEMSELQRWEKQASRLEAGSAEKKWLEFGTHLVHWQHRYDIEIQEISQVVQVGRYDIEIDVVDGDSWQSR